MITDKARVTSSRKVLLCLSATGHSESDKQ